MILLLSLIVAVHGGSPPAPAPGAMVATPITIRNLAGIDLGVWWLQPGGKRRMISQSAKGLRNSSSLELQSFRGHEFVVRPYVDDKELRYEQQHFEAVIEVGPTHDVIIVDEHMEIIRHDATWALRRAVARAMSSPTTTASDISKETSNLLEHWRDEWMEEEALRQGMVQDLIELGGQEPIGPIQPPGGFPVRATDQIRDHIHNAVLKCSGNAPLPQDPGWYTDMDSPLLSQLLTSWGIRTQSAIAKDKECEASAQVHGGKNLIKSLTSRLFGSEDSPVKSDLVEQHNDTNIYSGEAYMLASQSDAHDWCGRWARLGECRNNPAYMLNKCSRHCELWSAMGSPRYSDTVETMLKEADLRDRIARCVVSELEPLATNLRAAAHAERIAKSQFTDELRNRTCAATLPRVGGKGPHASDEPADTFIDADGRKIGVHPLFRSSRALPAANITFLPGFATPDECARAIRRGGPHLHTATVQGDDDASTVSVKRRAKAAQVGSGPDANDGFAKLWRRAVDAANHIAGYDLDPYGQEPFSLIYYNGTRLNTSGGPADEYLSHCDGTCDGSPHLHGGRVATVLIYCNTPQLGGATTFTKARTVAAPNANDAVFFSYMDKDTDAMDTGISTHSACPVLDGDKYTLVMWLRKGISQQDSWLNYEPSGARHRTAPASSEKSH